MSVENVLYARSQSKCELCGVKENLIVYQVPPGSNDQADECILICQTCHQQIENPDKVDVHHWRCLNESMWSQVPAVQVVAWRMLTRLKSEDWVQNLLDILYLEDETLAWAKAMSQSKNEQPTIKHVDSNGATLEAGDTVTLIKDLNVKGANFTAKRGTAVRGISLVSDNSKQIEGRVNDQKIVILSKFVKKSA